VQSVTTNPLGQYFTAIPWHNNQKKPERICWNFGDGRDTCINYNPNEPPPPNGYSVFHQYTQPGNYNACVTINYQGGCIADFCRSISMGEADSCKANFETLAVSSTTLSRYFIAQPWHNHNKKPVRICWNFGDNRDTCIQYLTSYTGSYAVYHQYAHTGTYNVCVNILYDGGCQSNNCKPVQIENPQDSCRADFEMGPITALPLSRHFAAMPWHSQNKKPVYICWNFGDNRDTCIQYSNTYPGPYTVNHNYSAPGQYEVCVRIVYEGGCDSRKCKIIQVIEPDSCRANFEMLSSNATALGKYFIAQPWHNHNKKPVQVCWNFGDNRDTCIQYLTSYTGSYAVYHLYPHAGTYNVCVKIAYDGGCQSYSCKTIQIVEPDSCRADFEKIPVTTGANLLTTGFRALPWNSNNRKPSRICWTFGDNRDTCINYPETYTGSYFVNHTYSQPGQYEVCVKILYFGGCEARKCKPIAIVLPPDTCRVQLFEITPSITSLTRGFYVLPSSSNNRRVERICWNFGDGTDSCVVTPAISLMPVYFMSHTYPGPGVYHSCVRVMFAGGCIAEKCIEVVIRNANDICGGYFTDSLIGPRTYKFRGQGIHNPNDHVISYRWSFGDGSSAIGQEVVHTFSQGSYFQACLLINTEQGCESRVCKKIIMPGPNAPTLQLSPNPVINNLHVIFISNFTETVNIRIINSNGLAVRNYVRNATTGPNVWDFDLSGLLPGIYNFIIQSPNQLASSIFLKQ
jgi:hypothetical protein